MSQDVESILPYAVLKEGEYQSLNYNIFHAFEVAAINNHEERICALEEKLKDK